MFRFTTAGESHGKALVCVIEGVPAGLRLEREFINSYLARRQKGYGRGGRMTIESDRAEIISGVRNGLTLGSPVALLIDNKDWENWRDRMSPDPSNGVDEHSKVTRPRPGHADLSGVLKFGFDDVRNVLERSSARETSARVAAGAVAAGLLMEFGVRFISHVLSIGGVNAPGIDLDERNLASVSTSVEASPVRCADPASSGRMVETIRMAKERGDSLGGVFEVVALGLPVGLGSYVSWYERLDGLLAWAMMSIQAIKGVEIGLGFEASRRFGSEVHDEIFGVDSEEARESESEIRGGYRRRTNNAGGLEGGMTNGEPLVVRAAMKPIPTLYKPLRSVDISTGEAFEAGVERSDACAVPAAAVVGEAMVATVLADAFTRKFGGDSLGDMKAGYNHYLNRLRRDD